jgi:hypothetical protein
VVAGSSMCSVLGALHEEMILTPRVTPMAREINRLVTFRFDSLYQTSTIHHLCKTQLIQHLVI